MTDTQNDKPLVISATDLQRRVGYVIRQVAKHHQRLIVERGGLPVMIILPLSDYEALAHERLSSS